jgi:hypothetical protein
MAQRNQIDVEPYLQRIPALWPAIPRRPCGGRHATARLNEGLYPVVEGSIANATPWPSRESIDTPDTRVMEIVYAFGVGHAGPATPLKANSRALCGIGLIRRRCRPAVHTSLSEPLVAGPDDGAAPSIAKPIPALVVVRAVAIRHILRPSSGQRRTRLIGSGGARQTIVSDRFIKRSERFPRRWVAPVLQLLRGGQGRLCSLLGVLDAPSPRRLVARRTGGRAEQAHRCNERKERASRTYPVHLRPHSTTHSGILPPEPPRKNMPSTSGDLL